MKVQLKREGEIINLPRLAIEINGVIYRLSESVDGQLIVNKVSIDGNDDYLKIHPRSGNEINLS